MLLGITYLAANVVCLSVLLARRYQRLFPCFLVAQALTTWQAGVRLFTGESRAWWTPGEALLLLTTIAAVGEALWTSVRAMRARWGYLIIAGLASASMGIVWWACCEPIDGGVFSQFLGYRQMLFCALGILSFAGFWVGLAINEEWPRVDRMHACLVSVLMGGHASLISWANWGDTNLHYRILEMACCVGWVINAGLLTAERREVTRKALRAVQPRPADHPLGRAEYPPSRESSPDGRLQDDSACPAHR